MPPNLNFPSLLMGDPRAGRGKPLGKSPEARGEKIMTYCFKISFFLR
jgi:hypothetical protein